MISLVVYLSFVILHLLVLIACLVLSCTIYVFLIAGPSWSLFRKLLNQTLFPALFKLCSITPILKSGDSCKIENYRLIAITSQIANVYDSVVLKSIKPAVNSILDPGQSTITYNMVYCNYIMDVIQHHAHVDVIYIDFSKAYEYVEYSVLLGLLDESGFCDHLFTWFYSYLTNRR